MTEWRQTTVGDLCDAGVLQLQTGPFGSQLHAYDYVKVGVCVVPTEAIRNRRIEKNFLPQVSSEKAKELNRHRLQLGDILFARRGVQATGHVAYVRQEEEGFLCGTGAVRLRTRGGDVVSPEFLSHVFADPLSIAWFKFHAIGATMPNLNEGIIRSFPLRLPPLPEQAVISGLLSALDDKIDLNRRMNETLEAMARAIFKDWFVDFGPVRAKMEIRNPPGLGPEIAALFTDRLSEDGLPQGWQSSALSGLLTQTTVGLQPAASPEKIFFHHSIPAFDAGQNPVAELGIAIKSNKTVIPQSAILMSKLNPEIPRVWLVGNQGGDGICSTEFLVYVPTDNLFREFAYCQLLEDNFRRTISGMVTGTSNSHQRVSPGAVMDLAVTRPTENLVRAFHNIAKPLLDKIHANRSESNSLAALRDLLLPKLMSGELRVKDAERLVEQAA